MNAKYQQWLNCPGMNDELLSQLKAMNEEQISDSFYSFVLLISCI